MSGEVVQEVRLFFQEGTSDKVYEARIVEDAGLYTVRVAWGRRGSRLNEGTKAVKVPRSQAVKKFESLVREKKGKGYEEMTAQVQPATVAPPEGAGSGSRVGGKRARVGAAAQLLNAIEDHELARFLRDDAMVAQQKLDGKRVLAHVGDDGVVLTNRAGQPTAGHFAVAEALAYLPTGTIVDGEVLGDDSYWLFDVLALGGDDLRERGYLERWSVLEDELEPALSGGARVLPVAAGDDKRRLHDALYRAGAEGIVFKDRDAPYTSGRPASGGTQRKYKFVKTADVVILENAGNAYRMAVFDGRRLVDIGKVFAGTTNDSRRDLDERLGRGEQPVAEVRYLYATADQQLFQPVFVGLRDDKPGPDCALEQLVGTFRGVVTRYD